MFNILNYGAVGDGKKLNTMAIQAAIDECAAKGGGRVVIPSGTFKTGTIWLKGNIELYLEMGAVLLASDLIVDYNEEDAYEQNYASVREKWLGKHLIIAHEVSNVAITGCGTIDGNCYAFVEDDFNGGKPYYWRHGITKIKNDEILRPGQMICFIESQNITVRGVTLSNAPCWTCFLHGCEDVIIHGVKVKNPINMLNADGFDVDTCRRVTISDCIVSTGDDCIAIRCDEKRIINKELHCEYITISNCIFDCSACAVRVGVGTGEISHVRVSNITVNRCSTLIRIQSSYNQRGCAKIKDVNFCNISAKDATRCFALMTGNGAFIKNVTLENIRAVVAGMSDIECQEDGELDCITLRNIEIFAEDRCTDCTPEILLDRGSSIIEVKNGKRIFMDHVQVHGQLVQCNEVYSCMGNNDVCLKDCNFGDGVIAAINK